jgi:hypothetical protein
MTTEVIRKPAFVNVLGQSPSPPRANPRVAQAPPASSQSPNFSEPSTSVLSRGGALSVSK